MSELEQKREAASSAARDAGAAGAATAGAGAALVATAATACCATPALASLTVTLLGASGSAWAAGLQPYAPWLLAGGALALAFGYWSVARMPAPCGGESRQMRRRRSWVRVALGLATLLWIAAVGLNLWQAT